MNVEVNKDGELIAPSSEYWHLQSDAMSEVISRKTSFAEKWALAIFMIFIFLLFAATWFIHYPDVVTVRATLVATNAPKEIIVRQEGRLTKLFAKNDETVTQGDVLGFIESNGKHEQVLQLNKYLTTILSGLQKSTYHPLLSGVGNNFDNLGELQQGFQQFMVACQQFSAYTSDGFYVRKRKVLEEDLSYLKQNQLIIEEQKAIMLKDLHLSEETYKANESLLKERVISKQDDRAEQSKLLGKQLSIPQLNTSLLNNIGQQRDKSKEINELDHTSSQQKMIFEQSLQTFQNQVNEWIKKYVLLSPITGRLSYLSPLQENQFLKLGRLIAYVNPPISQYYAEANLPQFNFGKIEIGQQVQLRFDAYPYQEFGYVIGRLSFKTDFATDSGFIAHFQLPNGLSTNQHKLLHFRDGSKAEAQIITKDMRLFTRFYQQAIAATRR